MLPHPFKLRCLQAKCALWLVYIQGTLTVTFQYLMLFIQVRRENHEIFSFVVETPLLTL
jgi:hypothetical protein